MCTRPTPSSGSVTASAHALAVSIVNALEALVLLFAALAGAPLRQFGHRRRPRRAKGLGNLDVQVHLGDASCVAELESIVWKTLARAQQTWAPLPLPLDRVVVGAGFPAAGRADIYDDLLQVAEMNAGDSVKPQRRVVVSLGVRDGTRDLDGWEIAGALAAQVQALVDEHCRQHRSLSTPVVAQAATRLAGPTPVEARHAIGSETHTADARIAATGDAMEAAAGNEVPSLRELLATVQEGQPLIAAGPSSNGTHP
jgi:hypothetical protein